MRLKLKKSPSTKPYDDFLSNFRHATSLEERRTYFNHIKSAPENFKHKAFFSFLMTQFTGIALPLGRPEKEIRLLALECLTTLCGVATDPGAQFSERDLKTLRNMCSGKKDGTEGPDILRNARKLYNLIIEKSPNVPDNLLRVTERTEKKLRDIMAAQTISDSDAELVAQQLNCYGCVPAKKRLLEDLTARPHILQNPTIFTGLIKFAANNKGVGSAASSLLDQTLAAIAQALKQQPTLAICVYLEPEQARDIATLRQRTAVKDRADNIYNLLLNGEPRLAEKIQTPQERFMFAAKKLVNTPDDSEQINDLCVSFNNISVKDRRLLLTEMREEPARFASAPLADLLISDALRSWLQSEQRPYRAEVLDTLTGVGTESPSCIRYLKPHEYSELERNCNQSNEKLRSAASAFREMYEAKDSAQEAKNTSPPEGDGQRKPKTATQPVTPWGTLLSGL
jgi:hypothetical protein